MGCFLGRRQQHHKEIETGFAQIGAYLGKGDSWAAAVYFLSKCKKPWLLVLDNADDPDLDLTNYIPAAGNGHILITTRIHERTQVATVGNIRLRGMDPEEAIELLLMTAYPDVKLFNTEDQKLAGSIASELGYLALALTHAGTAIQMKLLTLERYLNYYLGHRKTILQSSGISTAEDNNIRSTWEIPFRRIVDRQSMVCKDAVDLVHLFAFYAFRLDTGEGISCSNCRSRRIEFK